MTNDNEKRAQRLWEKTGIITEGYSLIGDHIVENEDLNDLN